MWTGKPAEAEAECRTALASLQKLVDDDPAVRDFRFCLAMGHFNLGIPLLQMGKPAEAEAECRTASVIMQKLVDENPAAFIFRGRLANALCCLGDAVRSLGRAAEAKGDYERSIALLQPLVQEDPTNINYSYTLVCSMRRRGLTLRDLGDPSGAAADTRRALGLCDGLPHRSGVHIFETACCHAALAGLGGRAGSEVSADEGKIEAARAIAWLRRAVPWATGIRTRSRSNRHWTRSATGPTSGC